MSSKQANNVSNLQFGFRGEGIELEINNKKVELWSTWTNGRRIFLDELRETDLTSTEKQIVFIEILKFVNEHEKKPIICFNVDFQDAELWERLSKEFRTLILDIEKITIDQENAKLYQSMVEELRRGAKHIFPNGLEISSIQYLNKHWDYIKIKRELNTKDNISYWDKIKSKFNL